MMTEAEARHADECINRLRRSAIEQAGRITDPCGVTLTVDEIITVQAALNVAEGKITAANAESVTAKLDAAMEEWAGL